MSFDAQETLFSALFFIAGAAMLSHAALGVIVGKALLNSKEEALYDDLFAVPNRCLGMPNQVGF